MSKKVLSNLIVVLLLTVSVQAQDKKPFSEINVGISGGVNSTTEPLTDFWKTPFAAEGFISTNFYVGTAEVGLKYIPLQSLSADQPSINSFFIYIGWFAELDVTKQVSVFAGIKAGSYLMRAEKGELSTYQQSESEFAFGPSVGLSLEIVRQISINIVGDYFKIYTFNRINFLNLSVGVSYRFYTLKWFREILE